MSLRKKSVSTNPTQSELINWNQIRLSDLKKQKKERTHFVGQFGNLRSIMETL